MRVFFNEGGALTFVQNIFRPGVWTMKLVVTNFTVFILKAGEEVLVGGQAVFEGVMMRTPKSYSIAVRKPDGSIALKKEHLARPSDRNKLWGYPLLRGIATLGQAFTLGLRALKFSTDEALKNPNQEKAGGKEGTEHDRSGEMTVWLMALNVALALFFFVLVFKLVPLLVASQLKESHAWLENRFAFSLLDGGIRLSIFLIYILLISRMRDIRRIFEYHGAEHKVVFTYESREPLSVQNARKYTTLHPRCGTSFLMVVMLTSILIYAFIPFDAFLLKLTSRIVLIPLIAGISYEIIRLAARRKDSVLSIVTLPGLWLQKLTTKEPGDDQLEVAITALEQALLLENHKGQIAVI